MNTKTLLRARTMKNHKPRNALDNMRSMSIIIYDIRFRQIL